MTIIPPIGPPRAGPNVQSTILVSGVLTLSADEILHTDTLEVLVTDGGVVESTIVNAGSMWNRLGLPGSVAIVVGALNFGAIVNSGLMVAESAQGSAQVINIQSSWALGGLHNTGQIFALAPNGTAAAVLDNTAFATILNGGIIAAQGLVQATALYRANGGQVRNEAGGRILAEADRAVAIYLGRGDFDSLDGPTIINAGEIIAHRTTVSGPASIGVLTISETGFPVEIVNSGLISGDFAIFADESGFSVRQQANEKVVNEASGILRGAVNLGGGDNILVNRGVIEGRVIVEQGADLVDTSGGAILGAVQLGWGNDRFFGGDATDIVVGDRGDDIAFGGAGGDLLLGGRGNDQIDGGAGRDRILGEFGDDTLVVEGGDIVAGGTGDDTIILRDYAFADVDGGEGFDRLVLAPPARILSLSAAVASGRLHNIEALDLPGAQTLIVTAQDILAISGGQQLIVGAHASSTVALVGAWASEGQVVVHGQTYRSYHLGGERVLVAGSGTVSIVATPPIGAAGLDAVGAGVLAPLPGSEVGAELTQSVTVVQDFDPQVPLIIDADEQWISDSGFAPINSGIGLPTGALTNNGSILSNGGINGAIAVAGEGLSLFVNNGIVSATGTGDPSTLPTDPVAYLQTLNLPNVVDNTPWGSYGLFSGFGYPLVNQGSISGTSVNSVGVGVDVWFLHVNNSGTIAGTSASLIGVGVYTHNGGTLTNSGLIMAEGELGAFAVGATTSGLDLINTGSIVAVSHAAISTSVGVDLYFQSFLSTINNSGLIQADVAIQTRFTFNPSGLVLYNSGQIVGRIELDKNPSIAADRADRIFNSGLISGDVFMGGERDLFEGRGGTQSGTVRGEDGNDALLGGDSADTFSGGDGDDLLAGRLGADVLTGGAGMDRFVFITAGDSTAAETDLITDFQSGIDSIDLRHLAPSSVSLNLVAGVTTITAQTASGVVIVRANGTVLQSDILLDPQTLSTGTAGSDILLAIALGSSLAGLAGDDVLIGLDGDDILDGGDGLDYFSGGAGNDTYVVNNPDDYVGEAPNGGEDTIVYRVGIATKLPDNVENMVLLAGRYGFGNSLDNVITGNSESNDLFGGEGGNDQLYGEDGDDSLSAGSGRDTLDGGAGHDNLSGGAGDDLLRGGAGDDFITGGLGNDEIIGGDGNDVASYFSLEGPPAGVVASLSISGPQDFGLLGVDTLTSIEGLIGTGWDDQLTGNGEANSLSGADGADILVGAAGSDTLEGGRGNDTLHGGDGDDVLTGFVLGSGHFSEFDGDDVFDGGAGTDTVSYENSSSYDGLFVVDLSLTGPQDTHAGIDSFVSIENLVGSSGPDTFIGSSDANELRGGIDNDSLSGAGGDDRLLGGEGNDTLDGGAGADTAGYQGAASGVSVSLAIVGAQDTLGDGVDTLSNLENLIGSAFNDTLTGDGLANVLEGGLGDDALNGGAGLDTASYADAGSGVSVSLALAGAQNTGGAGIDTLVSMENLAGSAFNDALTGNAGDNALAGAAGDDILIGGLGADSLDGGAGIDTASYASATSGVAVNLTLVGAQNTLSAGADTLTNIENVTGSAFGDTLTGDGGNNILSGGAGVDTLIGGLGDDTLIGGDNTDFIVDTAGVVSIDGGSGNEQITLGAAVVSGVVDGGVGTDQLTKGGSIAGLTLTSIEILNTNGGTVTVAAAQFEGFDTIRFSAGQPFTAVSLALSEAGTVDLTDELLGRRALFAGTSGNDTVTTSDGSDQIDGGAGDDVLSGGLGNDTLIGGLGDDVLSGGEGTDFLVELAGVVSVDGGAGDDVITLGAALNAGTVSGGLGTDQLNKGGAIAGLAISGIEIVNTNGGTLLATAAQLEGFDTIRFSAAQATTAVSLALSEAGTVDLVDELLGRRALFAGSSGNDVITTSNGSDQIDGGAGDDVLSGGLGTDTLIGGLGDDQLNGGDGGDFLVDLSGVVAIDGGDGDDTLTVGALVTAGTIAGGLGTDQLNKSGNLSGVTVSGIETINTNGGTLTATAAQLEGFDTIRFSAAQATAAISLVQAGAGTVDLTDELLGRRVLYQGSADNDTVTTSNGADRLDGGAGDDTLNGGLGNDTVIGGLGNDLIVQGATDGRDLIDGGAGVDTYRLQGTAAAETFRIMTRAEALLAGITGLAGSTEIVITRNGTDNASIIAELDNIEEIEIDSLVATANNGNGVVDGGTVGGDTVIVVGDFTTTSLDYSTITINGSAGNDTVDITGLTSAHRVVFASNGGADTVIGSPRPQDVFGLSDGLDVLLGLREMGGRGPDEMRDMALAGPGRGLVPAFTPLAPDDALEMFILQDMLDRPEARSGTLLSRTMIDSETLAPLDLAADAPLQIAQDAISDTHRTHDPRITPSEVDYILG